MMKFTFAAAIVFLLFSCKEKPKASDVDPKTFFPVLSFIKSQIAHVDTSLYPIILITTTDEKSDTTYIPREQFRKEAEEFLNIPDLTQDKPGKWYKEEKMFDETLGRVIMSYVPIKDNVEILRQDVVIIPTYGNKDQVRSIIIEKKKGKTNSTMLYRLLWQVDESFQVVTMDEGREPTAVVTKEVIWNKPLIDSTTTIDTTVKKSEKN